MATLGLALSCTGFFVKPTLTALAVGPISPTIFTGSTNNTVQMFAVGTFTGGSNSSTPVTWSISGTGTNGQPIATITPGGLVTAQEVGTGTVTASSNVLPSITGTQPITVSIACTTAPIISPTSGTVMRQCTDHIFHRFVRWARHHIRRNMVFEQHGDRHGFCRCCGRSGRPGQQRHFLHHR